MYLLDRGITLQPSKLAEEAVHSLDGLSIGFVVVTAVIEESVSLAVENHGLTFDAGLGHGLVESFSRFDGNQLVFRTQKHDRWRIIFADIVNR